MDWIDHEAPHSFFCSGAVFCGGRKATHGRSQEHVCVVFVHEMINVVDWQYRGGYLFFVRLLRKAGMIFKLGSIMSFVLLGPLRSWRDSLCAVGFGKLLKKK